MSAQAEAGFIHIKGARVHNLQNVELYIPRNQLVVFTGVSGSGKSSLVFDTLYAEGHRRYVESLSAYARQFLSRMQKPDVDYIHGLSPAIAIEQRVSSSNPRSTVGTATEILDYLRLLYARIGVTISPVSGQPVVAQTVSDVVDFIVAQPVGSKIYLLADMPPSQRDLLKELEISLQKGFTRLWSAGKVFDIEEVLSGEQKLTDSHLTLLIDRFVGEPEVDENMTHRMADSVQTAFNEGLGDCRVQVEQGKPIKFSERFERDGITFERPSVQLFNFNNSYGACPTCEGFGRVIGLDEDLVIPDKNKSVFEGAVAPWKGNTLSAYQRDFLNKALKFDFPIHRSYYELNDEEKSLLWKGNAQVAGIEDFFRDIATQSHKIQYRVLAARYRGYTTCPECGGTRFRKEALYVKIGGYSIGQLLNLTISELADVFGALQLNLTERQTSERLLLEINTRLGYLKDVGLGYLSLSRKMGTLSGGETQRINLATSLGSNLSGALYILDEPSIGLHPRDGDRLIDILLSLRDLGNSVLVVEHDEALMRRADYLVDVGPLAGEYGGQIIYAGSPAEIVYQKNSLTGAYLSGMESVDIQTPKRKPTGYIYLTGAREHNLKNIDVAFPLGVFTVVTGVSGSGKSTLVRQILYPALQRDVLGHNADKPGAHGSLTIDQPGLVRHVEMIDQNAIGKNVRSNPVTYVGAYDYIRELFATQQSAKDRGLKSLHFSFNVQGGRCETCQGEGVVSIQMQFLPDVRLTCETCGGKRFKQVVLEVLYQGKSIFDVLNLSIQEALTFFEGKPKIVSRLQKLADVGLGYVRLGQSTATLSGGEAQRLKLASFLDRQDGVHTLYLFDEPTTGLHFHDVKQLLGVLHRLVDQGNTVLIIEHNLDLIKSADWAIDIGPEGGAEGGELLYAGLPEGMVAADRSYTAKYLSPKLETIPVSH